MASIALPGSSGSEFIDETLYESLEGVRKEMSGKSLEDVVQRMLSICHSSQQRDSLRKYLIVRCEAKASDVVRLVGGCSKDDLKRLIVIANKAAGYRTPEYQRPTMPMYHGV